MTLGSVVIQDLTYTEKQLGSNVTISYVNGGLDGSEVVIVSGHDITVQIGASTATHIRAAILAHKATATDVAASDLVTCSISGTGSNVQKTCKNATLAGGHTSIPATHAGLGVGGVMLLTAVASGTSGNNIRFRFTGGATAGSEVVTVSTNDISVQIQGGVSTYKQVKAAIDASSPAHALVTVASLGPSFNQPAFVASAPAYQSLSGGAASQTATSAIIEVQDLTITANATGFAANGKTFSYTTGATAGAEVVTVTNGNIEVQIENGVSTATQIDTALNASTDFTTLYSVSISGTSSTAQKTVNDEVVTGEVGNGPDAFYRDQSVVALTTSFQLFHFGFTPAAFSLANRETTGTNTVVFSLDGITVHGRLLPNESFTNDRNPVSNIWLKYENGAPNYALFAN